MKREHSERTWEDRMIREVQAFVLECDARNCLREWTGGADETVEETRFEASRAGWVNDGGDLCPEHARLEEKETP